MQEEWRSIPDYPNYEVSDTGRVFNVRHARMIRPFLKLGYAHVTLYRDGRSSDAKVHRLVALAFIPNRFLEPEVNHLDGDKLNNYVENLEWTTRSKNMEHAYRTGLKTPTNKQALRIIETGEVFSSISECASAIDGKISAISRCLSGHNRSHRNLTFEYL